MNKCNVKYVWEYKPIYVLESIYYIRDWLIQYVKSPYCKSFMLDSGAFTFMGNEKVKKAKNIDWGKYMNHYADFINAYDIDLFFEMDIDNVIGYENVKLLRKALEQKTNKRCIPVWHKKRGREEFIKLCKDYDYVAIGGIASKEITRKEWPFLKWFINTAHENNCMIHGLGFTPTGNKLKLYDFDSVDSTRWTGGQRYASMQKFIGTEIKEIKIQKESLRLKNRGYDLTQNHNLREWVKFQRYMDEL